MTIASIDIAADDWCEVSSLDGAEKDLHEQNPSENELVNGKQNERVEDVEKVEKQKTETERKELVKAEKEEKVATEQEESVKAEKEEKVETERKDLVKEETVVETKQKESVKAEKEEKVETEQEELVKEDKVETERKDLVKEDKVEKKNTETLQQDVVQLMKKLQRLELDNAKLKNKVAKHEKLESEHAVEMELLLQKFNKLRVEKRTPRFADRDISVEHLMEALEYGESSSSKLLKRVTDIVVQQKGKQFYIGATSHPDTRIKYHKQLGYTKMHLLYSTPCYYDARDFETALLDRVFYMDGCLNKRNGSFGLVSSKDMFYVYMLQKVR